MMKTRGFAGVLLALLLVGCGGGGGGSGAVSPAPAATAPTPKAAPAPAAPNAVAPTAPPACSPSAYYPLCNGTAIFYSTQVVTAAHFDTTNHELVIDAERPGTAADPIKTEFTFQYTGIDCAGQHFYGEQYSFNTSNTLQSSINSASTDWLADSVWTSADGVQYIGEGLGPVAHVLSAGEPKITLNPIAQEEIDTSYTIAPHCGGTYVPLVGFTTKYWTVQHLATWEGFSDVWETTLIELAAGNETVYSYHFAKGVGAVGLACFDVMNPANNNAYSCGVEYIATATANSPKGELTAP